MSQTNLLSNLAGIKHDFVQRMNALWLFAVEDVAGLIRLSEINPKISPEMILSLLAYELNVSPDIVQKEFVKIVRDSIPDHEWFAIAKIEAPLPIGWLYNSVQRDGVFLSADTMMFPFKTLPSSINLVEKFPQLFQSIRNQDQRGTCVAFATTTLHEYIQGRLNNMPVPRLSEEFLYWASRNIQFKDMPVTCHQCGTYINSALKAIVEFGQCTHETLPYHNDHRPCNIKVFDGDNEDHLNNCQHDNPQNHTSFVASGVIPTEIIKAAFQYKLTDWEIVEFLDVNNIKKAISEGFPVLIGLKVYLSWNNPSSRHRGRINIPFRLETMNINYQLGGHAVLLIGYEDDPFDLNLKTPGGGYFLFRNSWGKRWGDESLSGLQPGYGMLPYDYLNKSSFQAFTLKPKNDYDKEKMKI